jgi:serine/threonine-protein kinase
MGANVGRTELSGCPTPDELLAFSVGNLPGDHREVLAGHIEGCDRCLALLQVLDDNADPLIAEARKPVPASVEFEQGSGTRVTGRCQPAVEAGIDSQLTGGEESGTGLNSLEHLTPAAADSPTIPGYEILKMLGRGGMGVVYQARHEALMRLVAIKMIRASEYAEPDEMSRFRTEAEAIARLQHPHIVQIHEIGEYKQLPFFSLEFCPGGSLAKRLSGTSLPPREAAALVEKLAQAMHAAHQKGVIHRDLKPANILLAEDGTPKVTDFGLAKKLDEAGQTHSGAIMGTPPYMAPEQARGQSSEVGPAADTYGLGAILYECLTGMPPFKAATALDTLRQVLEDEPVPPTRLNAQVPRDLETICLKCLQKEPRKRYTSAAALADELRRFGSGQPILARPVGPLGRLGRWARRQPVVAGLLGALLTALTLGLSGVSLLWQRAEAHLREAQHQRERAEDSFHDARRAVEQMLTEVGQERLRDIPEMDPVRRALLEKAAAFYEKFLRERGNDPVVREEAALAYNRVGLINGQLGRLPEAEAAYQQALSLLTLLVAQAPHEPRYRQVMAQTYFAGLGALYGKNQRYAEAERPIREALVILESLTRKYPDVVEYRQDLADCYNNLGVMCYHTHHFDEAETAHDKALRIWTQLASATTGTARARHKLATSHHNLGMVYRDSNRLKQAEESFQIALNIWRSLTKEDPHTLEYGDPPWSGYGDPHSLDYQDAMGLCCQNLGWLYRRYLGQLSKAEAAYQEGVKVYEKLAREHPAFLDFQSQLAQAYEWLAMTYGQLGKSAKAEAAYTKVLEIMEPLARARQDVLKYRDDLADAYHHLGWYHQSAGRLEQAESYYEKALPIRKRLADGDSRVSLYQIKLGQLHHERGILYNRRRRFPEAAQAYQEAIQIREKLAQLPPSSPPLLQDLAWSYHNLGDIFDDNGQLQKAEQVRAKALAIRERLVRENPKVLEYTASLATSYHSAGQQLARSGKQQEALAWYDQEIRLLEEALRQEPRHAEAKKFLCYGHWARAETLAKLDRHADALKEWDTALNLDAGLRRAELRMHRALALARVNDHTRAAAEAQELAQDKKLAGEKLFFLAGVYGLCIRVVRQDTGLQTGEQEVLAGRFVEGAMGLLVRARTAGFFKAPPNVERLKKDENLDSLRPRADFKKLLREVEAKAKPAAN